MSTPNPLDHQVWENLLRTSRYRKNQDVQDLLVLMNDRLRTLDTNVSADHGYPTLFVFGLPRSGTTLAYQLAAHCLDLGYIDNVAARFWLAPVLGLAVSADLLDLNEAPSFSSDYGKTLGHLGPHEFGYFWQYWLRMSTTERMSDFDLDGHDVDWLGLRKQVRSMQAFVRKGFVFKTMYVANFIGHFDAIFDFPIFIYIERDPYDVAESIMRARVDYYGTAKEWWATLPPEYSSIVDDEPERQVAYQVATLRRVYSRALTSVPSERVVRLSYEDLCSEPLRALDSIIHAIAQAHDQACFIKASPPSELTPRDHKERNRKLDRYLTVALQDEPNTWD